MSCCVLALAFAMQIIATWRRFKAWCGWRAGPSPVRDRGLGTVVATARERLRHPAVKLSVLVLVALEGGWLGGWVYAHRLHLGNEATALVFTTTGYLRDGCDGVAPLVSAAD